MLSINECKTDWDLSSLLQSDTDPLIDSKMQVSLNKCQDFIDKWKDRLDYLSNPGVLKEALTDYELLNAMYGITGNVGYYFSLRELIDQDNSIIKAQVSKLSEIDAKMSNDLAFFTHRLSKIDKSIQELFLTDPALKPYKHFLEVLFASAKYLLTEPEEKILNLKSQTSYDNWVRMTSEFISKEQCSVLDTNGNIVSKNFSEVLTLTTEKNTEVRNSAIKAANALLAKHSDVAEAELNSILQDKKINDDLRGMDRPDLAQHIVDDIDSSVVDALITAVSSRFDLSNRFFKIKAKLLGFDRLTYFERNLSYGDVDKQYTFDEALDLVGNTFQKLDPEFCSIFESYLKNGQVDVFPKKGKVASQFCTHGLKNQPGYIMLSFGGKFDDLTTLAHEMGHAINNELINKHQNALNSDTPLCTAEVASTFMEDFVIDEIEGRLGAEAKLSILMVRVSDFINAVFRQVACYQFEQALHATLRSQGYLNKIEIGDLFKKHMKNYLGDVVDMAEGSENWWVYWSHIRSYFYVYSYASGVLISKALQNMVKKDPSSIYKVKEFLSAGTSDSPRNIFLNLDIDIANPEFWKQGLSEVETLLNEIEVLGKKLGIL